MVEMKSDKRIIMIGPVLPFRGGIAQHTTMLHRAMQKLVEVETISFSRQYPAWLFPGESDRDPDYEGHKEPGVVYLIDSINPFTWHRAVKSVMSFRPELVVIPWWTIFWAPCFGYIATVLRRNGIKIVFFCHNVVEHETAAWKTWLSKAVLSNGVHFVAHTREDESNLMRLLPGATVAVQAHPIYDHFPKPEHTLPRRRGLELLFYGFVRPYKGLDTLIEAMGWLKGEDIQLTIAGEFWAGEEDARARISELGIEEQVEIRARYHSDQDTAELFARADVVVLPYKSATGSGVVPIAYHYKKPVVVTRVGGLPDVVVEGRTGHIVPADAPEVLAQVISTLTPEACQNMRAGIQEMNGRLSWEKLATTLLQKT